MEVIVHSTLSIAQGKVTVATSPDDRVDSLIAAFCIEKGIKHEKNYILRNKDNDLLTNTHKLNSCGIVNGDTVWLGMKAPSETWMFGCNQWILLAVVAFLIGVVGLVAILVLKLQGDEKPFNYGAVIDAGSSHSQIYLYKWDGAKENNTAIAKQVYTCRANGGGISSYTDNPADAGESLKDCLAAASNELSSNAIRNTTINLGATAGMRLLEQSDNITCQAILNSVRTTIKKYKFQFEKEKLQARIIEGKEEGSYSWVTANYLSNKFIDVPSLAGWLFSTASNPVTYGALDLGGASTQITFVADDGKKYPDDTETMVLYGKTYDVYTHSYLCYGLNEAYRQYLAYLVRNQNYTLNVTDPCGAKGYTTYHPYDSLFEVPCTLSKKDFGNITVQNETFQFQGQSNSGECLNAVKEIFNFTCKDNKCAGLDGVSQPGIDKGTFFLAFSGFYYTMNFMNQTVQNSSRNDYVKTYNTYCALSYSEIVLKYGKSDMSLLEYCFRAHYIDFLLTGYGFTFDNWNQLSFQKNVNGTDLGWSLGYMLNASNVIPQYVPQHATISLAVFIILVILFAVFLLIAIAFGIYAWTSSKKQPHYERLSTYGSTSSTSNA